MGKINIYNIVTNDKYEYPLVCDIRGAAAVGEILGMDANTVRKYCCIGFPRRQKRKAVVVGHVERKPDKYYYDRWVIRQAGDARAGKQGEVMCDERSYFGITD